MDFRDKMMTQNLPLCDTVDRERHLYSEEGRESEIAMWMLRQLTSVEKRKCHPIKRSKDQAAPALGLLRRGGGVGGGSRCLRPTGSQLADCLESPKTLWTRDF